MAKRSKQNLAELNAAIDQLGGGVAPIARPSRLRKKSAVRKRQARKKTARAGKKR